MKNQELNRRDFLMRVTALGALTTGSGVLLSACGGGESETAAPAAEPQAAAPQQAEGCMDTTGLSDPEIAMRTNSAYVDVSPDPEKLCSNCALYTAAEAGANCGGCQVIKGPIAPDGYCNLWAAMPST